MVQGVGCYSLQALRLLSASGCVVGVCDGCPRAAPRRFGLRVSPVPGFRASAVSVPRWFPGVRRAGLGVAASP
jgi:hypothetical protein